MGKIIVSDFVTTGQGAERLLLSRVKKINSDTRFENSIICPESEEAHRIAANNIVVYVIKITRGLGLIKVIKESFALLKIIKHIAPISIPSTQNFYPDILHTHNSKAGALGRIVCAFINMFSRKKICVIHQVHGYYFTKLCGIKKIFYYNVEKILAKMCDALLFQNRYEYELSMQFKLKKTKLFLIGNGIDFDEFSGASAHAGEDFQELTTSVDVKPSKTDGSVKNIVCIARIEPVKNQKMIIEAANILKNKKNYDSFMIYMIGEGDPSELKELAEKYKISHNVTFTGKMERAAIKRYLGLADLSVLTSEKEGMPRSLMESMYYAVPCVATNVVGTNEIIVDNYNGCLVPLGDYDALAQKLYFLLTNDDKRKEFGSNAKKYCLENFDENKVIDKIKNIYLTLTQEHC